MTNTSPRTIGVIGAVVWAMPLPMTPATAGFDTVCFDIAKDALLRGQDAVATGRYGFERGVERGKLSREAADAALSRLTFSDDFERACATVLYGCEVKSNFCLRYTPCSCQKDCFKLASQGPGTSRASAP